jgi:predicted RecA/RadA family phage recombinase
VKNYIQPGDTVNMVAPYVVASGAGALVGAVFGVAVADIANGVAGEFKTKGVFELAKTNAQAWAVGDRIYWDDTNKRADSDGTLGPFIGTCSEVAANPTAVGRVKLNESAAPRSQGVEEASPAPVSDATAGPRVYTAAEVLSGLIVRDPNGASRADTLPTAALLVAAVRKAKVGDKIRCLIVNGADAAENITVGAGAGGAFDANQTAAARVINQFFSKEIVIRLTNVGVGTEAYVVYA